MPAASHALFVFGRTTQLDAVDTADWRDIADNSYAGISGMWTPDEVYGLENPDLFEARIAEFKTRNPALDLELVDQARAALVVSRVPIEAHPEKITVIIGPEGLPALEEMMKLTRNEVAIEE